MAKFHGFGPLYDCPTYARGLALNAEEDGRALECRGVHLLFYAEEYVRGCVEGSFEHSPLCAGFVTHTPYEKEPSQPLACQRQGRTVSQTCLPM